MVDYKTDELSEWNRRTGVIKAIEDPPVPFKDIFERYLPVNPKFSCIEIGAIPGSFLVYFAKRFQYQVTGLDFAENAHLFHETMRINGIKSYKYIDADFLTFRSTEKYDVVCSFGFIEHFDNFKEIIDLHSALVKQQGYLVLTTPNFRFFQFGYHWLFDRGNLSIHNTRAMRGKDIDGFLKGHGFKKLYNGYPDKLELWRDDPPLTGWKKELEERLRRYAVRLGRVLPPSRFYSPALVMIYQKDN